MVLRRQAGYATSCIGDEGLSVDPDRRTRWRDGVSSPLSAREFALMHALDVLIHSMRKRFGRALIRNVRGIGWTLSQWLGAR